MCNHFERIKRLDFEISEVYASVTVELSEAMKNSSYKHTLMHLYSLVASCESIKSGIEDAFQSSNLYVSKSLLRSLVEHFLRFNYLCFSHVENKSDSVAKEFSEFCALKEEMDNIKANNFKNKITGADEIDVNEAIRAKFPNAKNLSNKQIDRVSQKWSYKRIVDHVSNLDIEGSSGMAGFLATLVPLYSQLSSFIHGGLSATEYVTSATNAEHEPAVIGEDYWTACRISGFTKVFSTMIAAESDINLLPTILQLNKLMGHLNGESMDMSSI